ASRNTRTYHKLVGLIHTGLARMAEVTVFLLVNTMKLDELHLRFGEARTILSQFLGYLPPQIIALALDMLNFASLTRTQIDQGLWLLFVIRHSRSSPSPYIPVGARFIAPLGWTRAVKHRSLLCELCVLTM